MSRVCQVTGKRPVTGNNVSHAMNHNKRRFLPNLQSHRFWVESEKRFVKLRVSTKGMRIIDKKGIDAVLADLRARGEKYKEPHHARENQAGFISRYWSLLHDQEEQA